MGWLWFTSLNAATLGTRNRDKAKRRLAREHARVAHKRNDALHKLTTRLCRNFAHVAIEDLGIKGMVRNRKLARAIHDMGWGEFRRQLQYKAKLYGCTLHIIDRFAPTSKRCNDCGHTVEKLPLQLRLWHCPACGAHHDRDINAAINIALTAVSYTVAACGAASSVLRVLRPQVKLAAVKQESSGKHGLAQVCLSLE